MQQYTTDGSQPLTNVNYMVKIGIKGLDGRLVWIYMYYHVVEVNLF